MSERDIKSVRSQLLNELKSIFDNNRDKKAGERVLKILETFIDMKIKRNTETQEQYINDTIDNLIAKAIENSEDRISNKIDDKISSSEDRISSKIDKLRGH